MQYTIFLIVAIILSTQTDGDSKPDVDGLIIRTSANSVAETLNRIEARIASNHPHLSIVLRLDQTANSSGSNITLRDTELLIIGDPKSDQELLADHQSVGIDLPQKFLAWEDDKKTVWLAFANPAYQVYRHHIRGKQRLLDAIRANLTALAVWGAAP